MLTQKTDLKKNSTIKVDPEKKMPFFAGKKMFC
jgi:hypothetical protein